MAVVVFIRGGTIANGNIAHTECLDSFTTERFPSVKHHLTLNKAAEIECLIALVARLKHYSADVLANTSIPKGRRESRRLTTFLTECNSRLCRAS